MPQGTRATTTVCPPWDGSNAMNFYPQLDEHLYNSLAIVHRIYLAILVGEHLSMRSEIEYFWQDPKWSVAAIIDSKDLVPECYAVVAAMTSLLVAAFNNLIAMGLPRDTPSILIGDMERRLKARPKRYEHVPDWAEKVPALDAVLVAPDSDGDTPANLNEQDADPWMAKKNVMTWTLPIYFV